MTNMAIRKAESPPTESAQMAKGGVFALRRKQNGYAVLWCELEIDPLDIVRGGGAVHQPILRGFRKSMAKLTKASYVASPLNALEGP